MKDKIQLMLFGNTIQMRAAWAATFVRTAEFLCSAIMGQKIDLQIVR